MPYKEGKKWRGTLMHQGKRHQALFPTRKAAAVWENEKRKELLSCVKKQLKDMDLMIFCTKYLDYSKRFTVKTYKEKKRLCRQIIEEWGANYPVLNIDSEMILTYLDKQAEIRSNNAFNKDRKNLLAMWIWGMQILEMPSNPVLKIRRRVHDRKPQYTPPQEDVLKVLAVADRQERIFLDCYLQTGTRRSEIYRWTWIDDIIFARDETRRIHVPYLN
ncbi:MAG: hypothetical protein JRG73_16620 [Deltaproteobacteria bacterium]|nr:hypothetical protein [Deltaproteobacteria bacterium]MBW2308552.1 hypothetical protein [Deltaproteobacteria bacterium]